MKMGEFRKRKTILLVSLLIYVLIFLLFIRTNFLKYTEVFSAAALVIFAYVTYLMLGYQPDKTNGIKKNIFIVTISLVLIFFTATYGCGLFAGFLRNSYSLELHNMFNNSIFVVAFIVASELMRYIFIKSNRDDRLFIILFTIVMIIVEMINSVNIYNYTSLVGILKFITLGLIPIIIKNVTLTYITYYAGYKTPIVYRLLTECYIFFVPIMPDLGDYITSVASIILPFFVYVSNSRMVNEYYNGIEYYFTTNSAFKPVDIPIVGAILVGVILISGIAPLYVVGIASASMEPNIKIGDAVILLKVNEKDTLHIGDVIAFDRGGKLTVHRIVEVLESDGEYYYNTKGDNNNVEDGIYLSNDDIKGVMLVKIPLVAYPSVWMEKFVE